MREVMAGRGQHAGQGPFRLNFGLGKATVVDSVVIRWPDASCSRKTIYNPQVNNGIWINSFPAGIDEPEKDTRIVMKLFPNPTSGYTVIQGQGLVSAVSAVVLTDVTGKSVPVLWSNSDTDKMVFDFSGVADGVYLVNLTMQHGETVVFRVQKQ